MQQRIPLACNTKHGMPEEARWSQAFSFVDHWLTLACICCHDVAYKRKSIDSCASSLMHQLTAFHRFLAAPETDAGWVYAARATDAPPPPLHPAALGVHAPASRGAREQRAPTATDPLLYPHLWAQDSAPEPSGGAFTAAAGSHGGFVRTVGPAVRAPRSSPGAAGSAGGSGLGLGSGSGDRPGGSGSLGAASSAGRPDSDTVGSGPRLTSGFNPDPTGSRLADRPPPAPEPAECAVLLAGACFSWAAENPTGSHAEAVRRAWEVGIPGGLGAPRELVLQDVSLAVRAGSLTVVVGEVGAGGCPHPRSCVDEHKSLCAQLVLRSQQKAILTIL